MAKLFLFIISGMVFALACLNGFAFDDLLNISENPRIKSWSLVREYFQLAAYPGDLYRPIVFISYYLNYLVHGLNPLGFHLVNIFCHQLVVLLIYQLCQKIISRRESFYAALIFAVHPLHSEVVANISGRPELFAALGILIACYAAERALRVGEAERTKENKFSSWLLVVFTSALFTLFSKESGLVVLLLVPLYLYCTRGLSLRSAIFNRPVVAVLLATLVYFAARVAALGFLTSNVKVLYFDNPLFYSAPWERLIVAWSLLGRYALLIFSPYAQSSDYSYGMFAEFILTDAAFNWWQFGLCALLVTALLLILLKHRKERAIFFAVGWFFAAFVVTANLFFPIGTIFAERLAYLPSLGLIILLAIFLSRYISASVQHYLLLVIVLVFAFLCAEQSQIWKNNETFYEQTFKSAPRSTKALVNYGRLLESRQQVDIAREYYLQALQVSKENHLAALYLAESYRRNEQFDRAQLWYERTLKIHPQTADAYLGLAKLAIQRHDLPRAELLLLQSIKLRPVTTAAHLLLVQVYMELKKMPQAQELFRRLQKYDPENPGLVRLQQKLEQAGILRYRK